MVVVVPLCWSSEGAVSGAPTGDPRYEVMVDRQEEGLRNVLVIHDADTHDFGAYNCSVVNEYGVARKQIRLNEESECSWAFQYSNNLLAFL